MCEVKFSYCAGAGVLVVVSNSELVEVCVKCLHGTNSNADEWPNLNCRFASAETEWFRKYFSCLGMA